jgi:hypothetical protein
MSATNVDLGNVEYVYLRSVDCNNGNGAVLTSSFLWNLPYMNPKEAPYMFIQVVQVYIDHDDGTSAAVPQHLMLTNVNGLNFHTTGGGQLATLLERDAPAGHWTEKGDAPMIQVPSNLTQIGFSLNENLNQNALVLGTDGSVEIVLKIVRPKRDAITSNTLASYVRTI